MNEFFLPSGVLESPWDQIKGTNKTPTTAHLEGGQDGTMPCYDLAG